LTLPCPDSSIPVEFPVPRLHIFDWSRPN
jgi:hypothetical protein